MKWPVVRKRLGGCKRVEKFFWREGPGEEFIVDLPKTL